jgi:hypothetical protein
VLACAVALHAATADSSSNPNLRTNLSPRLELAAMQAAIRSAPAFYGSFDTGCARFTPTLAAITDYVLAGNYRDTSDGCYVWLNLTHAPLLTAQEICKLTLHELGHLAGRVHSQDPDDVMFSPFRADPVPAPCTAPLPRAKRASARPRSSRLARTHRAHS